MTELFIGNKVSVLVPGQGFFLGTLCDLTDLPLIKFEPDFSTCYVPKSNIRSVKNIGKGFHGEVFEVDPYTVAKVVSLSEDEFVSLSNTISFLRKNKFPHIVETYGFRFAHQFDYTGSTVRCVYFMPRLNKLTDDEYKVFHTLVSHEDNNKTKQYSKAERLEILKNMSVGFEFDMDKVLLFCDQLDNSEFVHSDIHPRNIMKDADGSFKLVDIESVEQK